MSLDLRLQNLEAAFRRIPKQVETSTSNAKSGISPLFLSVPIEIQVSTTSSVAWTTYEASRDIPLESVLAIIEVEYALDSPDTGDEDAHVRFRSREGEIELVGARGRAGGSSDSVAGANQLMVPLSYRCTFDYTIEAPGFSDGCVIRLIGYWK